MKQNIKRIFASSIIVISLFCACITTYTSTFAIPSYANEVTETITANDSKFYSSIVTFCGVYGLSFERNSRNLMYAGVDKLIGGFIDSEQNLTSLGRKQIYNDVLNKTTQILGSGNTIVGMGFDFLTSTFFPNFKTYIRAIYADYLNGDYNAIGVGTFEFYGNTYPCSVINTDNNTMQDFAGFLCTPYQAYATWLADDYIEYEWNNYNYYAYTSNNTYPNGNTLYGFITMGYNSINLPCFYVYSGSTLAQLDVTQLSGLLFAKKAGAEIYYLCTYNPFTNEIKGSRELNYGTYTYGSYDDDDLITFTPNNNTTSDISQVDFTYTGTPPTTTDELVEDLVEDNVEFTNNGGGSGGSSTGGNDDTGGQGGWLGSALNFLTNLLDGIINKITDLFSNIAEKLTLPDIKNKFPFSIPFDLISFFNILNATPVTPTLDTTINLGITNWVIDWDLNNFNDLATLLRNLEFIGFSIGLILLTKDLL